MEIWHLYGDVLVVLAQRLEKQGCRFNPLEWQDKLGLGKWKADQLISCPEQPPACKCVNVIRVLERLIIIINYHSFEVVFVVS